MSGMSHDDGGSAFPVSGGMSLRDWFAGQALSTVLTHYLVANGNGCAADHALRNVPALAYKYADAMLEARKS